MPLQLLGIKSGHQLQMVTPALILCILHKYHKQQKLKKVSRFHPNEWEIFTVFASFVLKVQRAIAQLKNCWKHFAIYGKSVKVFSRVYSFCHLWYIYVYVMNLH